MLGCIAVVAACSDSKPSATGSSTTQAQGTPPTELSLNTGDAPWPDPDHVPERTAAAGLTGGDTEVTTVHYHGHLDILVNGTSEPVAGSIGRVDQTYFSPLHTHATSGMIHVEAPTDEVMTLGMLFTEWGVRLTDTCIGGYCSPDVPISAYVNGKAVDESLPAIVIHKGQEIAIVIGSPPATIPSSWDCDAEIDAEVENPAQCTDFQ
jgi:hypothetical protein